MTEAKKLEDKPQSQHEPDAVAIEKALRRAFSLGQMYWQQADSESYRQNRKASETLKAFNDLVSELSKW